MKREVAVEIRVISVEYVRQPGENKITLCTVRCYKKCSVPVFAFVPTAVWVSVNAGFIKGMLETHGTVLNVSPH